MGETVRYTVTASTAFTRLDVKLRWGDGPEDALVSLAPGQSHTFSHTYGAPGQYGVHITASGPLAAGGGCNVFEDLLGSIVVSSATAAPPPPPAAFPPGPVGVGGQPTLGTRTVASPRPDGTATVGAPGLLRAGATSASTGIGSAAGFGDTTIVAQAGETPAQTRRRRIGEAVVACWLLGLPDAPGVNAPGGQGLQELKIEINTFIDENATSRRLAKSNEALFHLYFFIGFVRAMAREQAESAGPASAAGCRSSRVALRVRRDRAGRVAKITASRAKPAFTAARYSCVLLDDRTMIVRAARRKGPLVAQIGRNLRFGIHRAPTAAPALGTLRFGFGLRGA